MADGDGRALLNLVEQIAADPGPPLERPGSPQRVTRRAALFDKSGDGHYNLISALHKSVRGLGPRRRALLAGADARGGRRPALSRAPDHADGGRGHRPADPAAQRLCLDAWATYERLGSPEGELALAEAVIYLALAPKSNAAYTASRAALASAERTGSLVPPKHILNAPTRWMKSEASARAMSTTTTPRQDFRPGDFRRKCRASSSRIRLAASTRVGERLRL